MNNYLVVKILIWLFSFIYIIKQTIFINEFGSIINFLLLCIMIGIMLLHYFSFKINSILKITFLSSFMSFFSFLFFGLEFSMIIFLKLLFIFSFLKYKTENEIKKIFLELANSFSFIVFLLFFLSLLGLLDNKQIIIYNWIKNSGIFLNPNVPMEFLFSSLVIYFILNKNKSFYLLIFITISFYFLDFYSRTFLISSILLLLIKYFKDKVPFPFFMYFYVFNYIFVFGTLILLKIYYFKYDSMNFPGMDLYEVYLQNHEYIYTLDKFLSWRIFNLYQDFLIYSEKFTFGVSFIKIDSIFYEGIFVLSPILYISILISFFYFYKRINNNVSFFSNYICFLSLLSFIGFFEGFFTKLMPIIILIFYLTFFKFINKENNENFISSSLLERSK